MRSDLARVTLPEDGASSPTRMRSSLVLPIPLGPMSASRAPRATEKETSRKISSAPKDLERDAAVIRDIGMPALSAAEQLVYVFLGCGRQRVSVPSHGGQIPTRLQPVVLLCIDARGNVLHRLQV